MQYRVDSLGLSGGVTPVLRDLIHQRLGLFYDVNQFDQLADRLAPLVVARGFGSFMDYYYFLKYSAEPAEWTNLMDALAVHETYFWREIDQLRAVVDVVVPYLARQGASSLRIWSVPCSTGEEPLTLAMLLSEAGWFHRLPIEVMASDASPEAIAAARAGQ
jgi:chemotaxis protein methyltransferase CheR